MWERGRDEGKVCLFSLEIIYFKRNRIWNGKVVFFCLLSSVVVCAIKIKLDNKFTYSPSLSLTLISSRCLFPFFLSPTDFDKTNIMTFGHYDSNTTKPTLCTDKNYLWYSTVIIRVRCNGFWQINYTIMQDLQRHTFVNTRFCRASFSQRGSRKNTLILLHLNSHPRSPASWQSQT